jgi:hypothetical protein
MSISEHSHPLLMGWVVIYVGIAQLNGRAD